MSDRGILSVGGYAPETRLPTAEIEEAWGQVEASNIEETAVPDADEDALTMGYEAARRALDAADIDSQSLAGVAFATTTPPMAESEITVHLSELFALPETADLQLYTGSTRVGLQALTKALTATAADGLTLVVVADCPQGPLDDTIGQAAGAGAAAFVIGNDAPVYVLNHATYAESYQGTRFRPTGREYTESLDITQFDREAFTTTTVAAVEHLEVEPSTVDAAAIQAPDGALPYRTGSAVGLENAVVNDVATVHELGDTGAASVPLSLARALADGSETVLAVAFGSGAVAEAAVFETASGKTPSSLLALDGQTKLGYTEYLRQTGEITSGAPDGGGAYISVPAWKRSLAQRYRLEAGRCPHCERLNFPPSGACSHCADLVTYESVQLKPTGEIEAVTEISQGGAPPEFVEQQARTGDYTVAIVAIDGPDDDSASIPAQVIGAQADAVDIGDRVEFAFRRIYTQENVIRYGLKFQALSG
jgi:hydroxymethylglutaryl-CoA synthase